MAKPDLALTPAGLRLRPLHATDLPRLIAFFHDPDVRRYLCDGTIVPAADIAALVEKSLHLNTSGLGHWVIERESPHSDPFAGIIGLMPVERNVVPYPAYHDGIEPIVGLEPAHWRQGLGTHALCAVIRYAFESLALPHLVAGADEPDTASNRLLKGCGFRETGTVQGPAYPITLYRLDRHIDANSQPQ